MGAILRREGLYSSHLVEWRRARDRGALEALARPVGRPRPNPLAREVERLRRDNARLTARLTTAERIIEIQSKVSALLGIPPGSGERRRADPVLMATALELAPLVGLAPACRALGVSRAHALPPPSAAGPARAGGPRGAGTPGYAEHRRCRWP